MAMLMEHIQEINKKLEAPKKTLAIESKAKSKKNKIENIPNEKGDCILTGSEDSFDLISNSD